jgi:ABC-type Fe3+/spermidine/putrescine transport system ATPase subunit
MNDAPHLRLDAVSKSFGDVAVLRDISLAVPKGAFVALLGPSGCGKSTLLKIIAGLEAADSGRLHLDGAVLDGVPAYRRDIGMVFQNYALFPHLSVRENVRFGLDMRPLPKAEAGLGADEALDLVQLADYGRRMPADLSGGQQQRVALARALAIRPRLLLLDEPLSNLDALLRKTVRLDIRDLHERSGSTTIMVTHDQEEAMSMADIVAVMSEGRIVQSGTPEDIYERPATRFVGGFVGSPPANLLTIQKRLAGGWHFGAAAWLPAEPMARRLAACGHQELDIGLRPESLTLSEADAPGAIPADVRGSHYLGGTRLVQADAGGQRLTVLTQKPAPATGMRIGLMPDPAALLLFDASDGRRIETA